MAMGRIRANALWSSLVMECHMAHLLPCSPTLAKSLATGQLSLMCLANLDTTAPHMSQ